MFDELINNKFKLGFKGRHCGFRWSELADIEDELKKTEKDEKKLIKEIEKKLINIQNKNYNIYKKDYPFLLKNNKLNENDNSKIKKLVKINILQLNLFKSIYNDETQSKICNCIKNDLETLNKISLIVDFHKIIFNIKKSIFIAYILEEKYNDKIYNVKERILNANKIIHNMIGKKINECIDKKFKEELNKEFSKYKSVQIL